MRTIFSDQQTNATTDWFDMQSEWSTVVASGTFDTATVTLEVRDGPGFDAVTVSDLVFTSADAVNFLSRGLQIRGKVESAGASTSVSLVIHD